MPRRRTPVLAAALLAPLLLTTTACGSDPEPLEALPPAAPEDLCSLLPESLTQGYTGSASSSQEGDPTAACALRSGDGKTVLVTYLQLEGEPAGTTAFESQCAAIDRRAMPERDVVVEGTDDTCAGAGDDRSSLAVVTGRDLVTVRTTGGDGATAMRSSVDMAAAVLDGLPQVQ